MATNLKALTEQVTYAQVLYLTAILGTLAIVAVDTVSRPRYPDSLPRIGSGTGLFATIKDYFLAYVRHKKWVHEGYEKYSKHGTPYVLPAGLGRRSVVVLPKSQIKWLLNQPDHLVSPDEANNDSLYAKWNFLGKKDPQDAFNNRFIHRNLIRSLNELVPGMQEEVQDSMDRVLGYDTEKWNTINIWDMWMGTIPQITNRMVLGKDLARNPKLLHNMVGFTESVLRNIFLFDFLPRPLHTFLGPLLALPNRYFFLRGRRLTIPLIKQRLLDMERKATDLAYKDWKEPEDCITWIIRQGRADGNTFELDPYQIARRILLVEVASLHTTAMTAQNALLDVLSSDQSVIEALREEASRVFQEENGVWTQAGLSRLYRIDSAIRESQRRSNFAITLLDHKVIAQEGLTNKDQGWHLPYGSIVTLNIQGMFHDPSIHDRPEEYDALRCSRPIEEFQNKQSTTRADIEGQQFKKLNLVTTSEEHLVFGHGRHACPGRFFVAHELKMAFAHMLLNYEIKPLQESPKRTTLGNFVLPPFQANMVLRRRKDTEVAV